MSWYEETSKNNGNDNNNGSGRPEENNNEERTVNSKGYIDADDPAGRTENAYDRPFEGTAREEIGNSAKKAESAGSHTQGEAEHNVSGGSEPGKNGDKPPYYEVKVKSKKKGMTFGKVVAVCLVCSLGLGTGLGAGYGIARAARGNSGSVYDGVLTTTAAAVSSVKSDTASDAISSVYSAVVSITSTVEGTANYGLYSVPYRAVSAGSGVIFAEDESLVYVATN